MNKVVLMGRLTRDVEMYQSSNNNAPIARYTLVVNRQFRREGEPDADFFRCISFGKNAEISEKYLKKGMKILIEGKIQLGSYTNREGQKVYTTDIVVERQEFCESRANHSQPEPNATTDADSFMDIPNGTDEEYLFN